MTSIGGFEGGTEGGARERMYIKGHCSPGDSDVEGSCLDDDLLKEIANEIGVDTNQKIKTIHGDIAETMEKKTDCKTERCWLNKLKNKLTKAEIQEFKRSFKPDMPKKWEEDHNEWLTTEDIEKVMGQYAEAFNDVYFYGAVPIDFSKCSVSNLCSFNLRKHLQRKEHKIGIVFNTDPHNEDGEHWITMGIFIRKPQLNPQIRVRTKRKSKKERLPKGRLDIYYFDSFGRKPPKEIQAFVEKVEKQARKCKMETEYHYNDIRHQKGDSQCGVYAIHFLDNMLTDKMTFQEYLQMRPTDQDMIEYRRKAFIPLSESDCKQ